MLGGVAAVTLPIMATSMAGLSTMSFYLSTGANLGVGGAYTWHAKNTLETRKAASFSQLTAKPDFIAGQDEIENDTSLSADEKKEKIESHKVLGQAIAREEITNVDMARLEYHMSALYTVMGTSVAPLWKTHRAKKMAELARRAKMNKTGIQDRKPASISSPSQAKPGDSKTARAYSTVIDWLKKKRARQDAPPTSKRK